MDTARQPDTGKTGQTEKGSSNGCVSRFSLFKKKKKKNVCVVCLERKKGVGLMSVDC